MRLIVGLGNPGSRYRRTRHNIGFLVLEKLAKDQGLTFKQVDRYRALVARGEICGEEVVLLAPQTYMNLSGDAVAPAFKREIRKLENLIVVIDDVNLELGRIRIKPHGSSGRHKGLGSVIEKLGTADFTRLRLGVASEALVGDIADYVLGPFRKDEAKAVSAMIESAKNALCMWLEKGTETAMSRFNRK